MVTPEIAALPPGMARSPGVIVAKAGGMADVTAAIVTSLFELGADVHVALPNYRKVFRVDTETLGDRPLREYRAKMPDRRIHFAEDSIFYYKSSVYAGDVGKAALRFQREVINNIIHDVQPDLIHCNDWTTGLIPGMARRLGIHTLFSIHNVHTHETSLDAIEDTGIGVRDFWKHLYYKTLPRDYESTREHNKIDLLVSGIFSANFINTVSPTFLKEIEEGHHEFVSKAVRDETGAKIEAECAFGILNAPPAHYNPKTDDSLIAHYGPSTHRTAKAENKATFQKELGLPERPGTALFFWPSRLDPVQKGCELLTHVLPDLALEGVQIAVVADGPAFDDIQQLVRKSDLTRSVAVHTFNERLSRLGFAGSDFILMPSRFEPCGLPQMIGTMYGSLPIVHDTGGLHDTVEHLDTGARRGNGFVFKHYDSQGFRWAIDEARRFYALPEMARSAEIERIMTDAVERFSHEATARSYFELYERILSRPLVRQ